MSFVVIGKVLDTFGLEGELKIMLYAPEDILDSIKKVYFKKRGGDYVPFEVEYFDVMERPKAKVYILKLKDIDSIDLAEQFKGAKIFYPEEELPERGEDEFYAYELIDMDVYTDKGRYLGKVKRIEDYGVYDMIILEDEKIMFPFVNDIVLEVDREKRTIKVKEDLIPL